MFLNIIHLIEDLKIFSINLIITLECSGKDRMREKGQRDIEKQRETDREEETEREREI